MDVLYYSGNYDNYDSTISENNILQFYMKITDNVATLRAIARDNGVFWREYWALNLVIYKYFNGACLRTNSSTEVRYFILKISP
jgi:hypothetical protein